MSPGSPDGVWVDDESYLLVESRLSVLWVTCLLKQNKVTGLRGGERCRGVRVSDSPYSFKGKIWGDKVYTLGISVTPVTWDGFHFLHLPKTPQGQDRGWFQIEKSLRFKGVSEKIWMSFERGKRDDRGVLSVKCIRLNSPKVWNDDFPESVFVGDS